MIHVCSFAMATSWRRLIAAQRILLTSWCVSAGQIMDWDTRPKNAGGSDPNFSAAMYAELISEDI